jgi:hypothetical protein
MGDLSHDQRNRTTAWISKLNGKWKIGGYIRLKNPLKLRHHNLNQLSLDL